MKITKIIHNRDFKKQYKKLPLSIQLKAEEIEKIFRKDPFHPSLKTHSLTGTMKGLYAFSVNFEYRIVFYFANKQKTEVVFFKIGTHSIYQ